MLVSSPRASTMACSAFTRSGSETLATQLQQWIVNVEQAIASRAEKRPALGEALGRGPPGDGGILDTGLGIKPDVPYYLYFSIHSSHWAAEPRPDARRLGGEEWIENTGYDFGRYPRAIVGYFHRQAVPCQAPCADEDSPNAGLFSAREYNGLLRVHDQVQHHLLELRRVRQ